MNIKSTFSTVFAFFLLVGCGKENSSSLSDNADNNKTEVQSTGSVTSEVNTGQSPKTTSSHDTTNADAGGDECSVQATWTGDFEGSVDWAPEKAPSNSGFTIEFKSFMIETGLFNLTADFETPLENGKTGTFTGKAKYFYVTDAPYEGPQGVDGKVNVYFPMQGDQVARGVPVTLEITEWQATRVSGSVSAGPFTGVAGGPQAPRDGGSDGPLKPITVSGSAQFHASRDFSGDTIDAMVGRIRCHQPYIR